MPSTPAMSDEAIRRGWWIAETIDAGGGLVRVTYVLRDGSRRIVGFRSAEYTAERVRAQGDSLVRR